jgi:hypothetical protein
VRTSSSVVRHTDSFLREEIPTAIQQSDLRFVRWSLAVQRRHTENLGEDPVLFAIVRRVQFQVHQIWVYESAEVFRQLLWSQTID